MDNIKNTIKEKYEKSKKYQASFDDPFSRYSLRNSFGFYFEYRKFRETIKLLNYAKLTLTNKKILDIGCHRGFQLGNLAFLKGSSSNLYGIDFIPDFIQQAKRINPKINFKIMNFYDLRFKDSYFDLITLYYVINCIPVSDRVEIINNLSKKVKKNGYILVFEHSDNFIINSIRKIIKFAKKENISYIEYANDKIIKKYFKGFKIIKSRRLIGFLSPKLCNLLPYFMVEMFDYFTPNNYYITLLKKVD